MLHLRFYSAGSVGVTFDKPRGGALPYANCSSQRRAITRSQSLLVFSIAAVAKITIPCDKRLSYLQAEKKRHLGYITASDVGKTEKQIKPHRPENDVLAHG